MKQILAYKCDWCDFVRRSPRNVKRHESRCHDNPDNRSCKTCRHWSVDYQTVYNPYHGGEPGSTDYEVKYAYCTAKYKEMEGMQWVQHCDLWEAKFRAGSCRPPCLKTAGGDNEKG